MWKRLGESNPYAPKDITVFKTDKRANASLQIKDPTVRGPWGGC